MTKVVLSLFGGAAIAAAVLPAQPAAAGPARMVLFRSGTEACYHVPAMVRAGSGTLVAAAEQRFGYNLRKATLFHAGAVVPSATGPVTGCADSGNTNIVFRVSRDGGQNWSTGRVLIDHADFLSGGYRIAAAQNPTLISHGRSITLVFAVLRSAGARNEPDCLRVTTRKQDRCSAETQQGLWSVTSRDDGATWSSPRVVATGLDPHRLNRPGPGHGIVIGARMVLPTYGGLLLSDNDGRSWRIGATTDKQQLDGGEASVAALADGMLWSFQRPSGRSYRALPAVAGFRISAYSADNGNSFRVVDADTRFPMPPVSASLLAWNRMLFVSSPRPVGSIASKVTYDQRSRMTVAFSGNNGKDWRTCLVDPGSASYSDLAGIDARTVGLIYEGSASAGSTSPKGFVEAIVFRRLSIASLSSCGADAR